MSCLQLGFYLASRGMLRGSSTLLRKSARHYELVIDVIDAAPAEVWDLDADRYSTGTWRREHGPVGPPEPGLRVHPVQHGYLLAQDQYPGVLRSRRTGHQRQPRQHRDSEPGRSGEPAR